MYLTTVLEMCKILLIVCTVQYTFIVLKIYKYKFLILSYPIVGDDSILHFISNEER